MLLLLIWELICNSGEFRTSQVVQFHQTQVLGTTHSNQIALRANYNRPRFCVFNSNHVVQLCPGTKTEPGCTALKPVAFLGSLSDVSTQAGCPQMSQKGTHRKRQKTCFRLLVPRGTFCGFLWVPFGDIRGHPEPLWLPWVTKKQDAKHSPLASCSCGHVRLFLTTFW
jgi:hypothetical protein